MPNCAVVSVYFAADNFYRPALSVFTVRQIEKGDELCISYRGQTDEEEVRF